MDCIKHRHGSVIPSNDIEVGNTLKAWSSKTKSPNQVSNRNVDIVPVHTITVPEEENKKLEEFHYIEILEALQIFENSRCCSTRLTDEMDIKRITMSEGYIYKAHALVEQRVSELQSVPYEPEMIIDGPENGPAPSIWSIYVNSPKDFSFESIQGTVIDEIPHTASKVDCDDCHKKGYLECDNCDRTGIKKCPVCHGNGVYTDIEGDRRSCDSCDGREKIICSYCRGEGQQECFDCDGCGFVKKFQKITVEWEVLSEKNYYCVLPEKQVKKVTGKEKVYHSDDCEMKNNPLAEHHDERVREMSESALQKFRIEEKINKDSGNIVIRVQQTVIVVLIAKVIGMYKGKLETFYVFGNEQKVFFPNGYPGACSCCSIM